MIESFVNPTNKYTYYIYDPQFHAEIVARLNNGEAAGLRIDNVEAVVGGIKSMLDECPNIIGLWIHDRLATGSFTVSSKILKIKYLDVGNNIAISDFTKMPELEYFYGMLAKKVVGLESLSQLTTAYFWSLKNTSIVSLPPSLELLVINGSSLVDLNCLDGLDNLKKFSIAYSPKLLDISMLERLESLAELEFTSCKKAMDLEVMSKLANLNKLRLSNCGEIPSVAFVTKLKKLTFFAFVGTKVADGDLGCLLESSSLRYVGFIGNRYSHKFKEINALLCAQNNADRGENCV